MLALPCAPEGRPDAAAAAVMLAGLLPRRGLARLRDGDELHDHALVAVATINHLSLFFLSATWCRCSWRRGAAGAVLEEEWWRGPELSLIHI